MHSSRRALLIGISYQGQTGPYGVSDFWLNKAHEDVWRIHEFIQRHYDYQEESITIMLDKEGYLSPTRENIISEMKKLVADTKAGDKLFFFFAGHGDQIKNLDGTESDGKDEIILPLDWELNPRHPTNSPDMEQRDRYLLGKIIIDDELHNYLVKPLQNIECQITGLFDACHSGTIMDLTYCRYKGPRSPKSGDNATVPVRSILCNERTQSPVQDTPEGEEPEPPKPAVSGTAQVHMEIIHEEDFAYLPQDIPSSPPDHASRHNSQSDLGHNVINRARRIAALKGHFELPYAMTKLASRGHSDPYFRKGTWVLRGDTYDPLDPPKEHLGRAISWSACSDGQMGFEGVNGGVMVDAFVKTLSVQPKQTFRAILNSLAENFQSAITEINHSRAEGNWVMQEPQLGSDRKPDLDAFFEL